MLYRILNSVVAVAILASFSSAQIYHDGENLNGTWSSGSWHIIRIACPIQNGSRLEIEDNVLVEFYRDQYIQVHGGGELDANASGGEPIIFTSLGSVATPGYWKALIAQGSSGNLATMTLTNCEIQYGGEQEVSPTATSGPVRAFGYSTVTVSHCYIHNNLGDGAGSNTENNQLTVTDSRINSCDMGLKLAGLIGQTSKILRNRIISCGVGIYHHGIQAPVANNFIDSSTVCGSSGYFINFSNNIIARTLNGGNGIEITDGVAENYSIANNILYCNQGWGIYYSDPQNPRTVRDNCYFANTQGNRYGVTDLDPLDDTDPLFVGAGFGDEAFYHLRWDSPCLGQGYNGVEGELHNSNSAESQNDIGAYGGPELDPGDETILMSLSKP